MARSGITQDNVNAAADALLLGGERPTIERVRAKLGTGSPNTLIRLLDAWWSDLGARLHAQNAKLEMPGAPASVVKLSNALWEKALYEAEELAKSKFQAAQDALCRERESLEAERLALTRSAEELADRLAAAEQAEALAVTRFDDASRLISQQGIQIEDATRQRDASLARANRLEHEIFELRTRQSEHDGAVLSERSRSDQYIEALEKRTAQEIDRARQEAKITKRELSSAIQKHERVAASLRKEYEAAIAALGVSKAEATAQRARADTLERQQAHLSELADTVRGALKASSPPSPAKRTRQKLPPGRQRARKAGA